MRDRRSSAPDCSRAGGDSRGRRARGHLARDHLVRVHRRPYLYPGRAVCPASARDAPDPDLGCGCGCGCGCDDPASKTRSARRELLETLPLLISRLGGRAYRATMPASSRAAAAAAAAAPPLVAPSAAARGRCGRRIGIAERRRRWWLPRMALLGRTLLRQPRGLHQRPPAAAAGHLQPAASAARSAAQPLTCFQIVPARSPLWLCSCAQVGHLFSHATTHFLPVET
jgi:hypothetical protein